MSDEYEQADIDEAGEQSQAAGTAMTRADVHVAPAPLTPVRDDRGHRIEAASLISPRGSVETTAAATAIAAMQAQMQLALMNPRDIDLVRQKLHRAMSRFETADKATYSYPRGTTQVVGPSVYLAREMAIHWRNLTTGSAVIEDNDETRTVRVYAWDMETNIRKEMDVSFRKVVERKVGNKTQTYPANERDLLELTNKASAKAERNVLLALMPDDLKRDAVVWAQDTVKKGMTDDPEAVRKKIVTSFGKLGVTPKELEAYLGRPLETLQGKAAVNDLQTLRGVFSRMQEGESTWHMVVLEKAKELGVEGPPPANAQQLAELVAQKAAAATKKKKE